MNNSYEKINYEEAELFYKSPFSFVNYSDVQSFTLIKSSIELFAYYGAVEFSPKDVKSFFEKLQITQSKNGRVFIPSEKKVDSVLECCLAGANKLKAENGSYKIVHWNTDGYYYELERLKEKTK